jgi:peptide methionine sulfoxide reductase msrA/msrB
MKKRMILTAVLCLILCAGTWEDVLQEESMNTIYLAGGCFWGLEKLMSLVPGVQEAQSGYANGHVENPTYEQVCRGDTGHRETVKVIYDPAVIGLRDLMRLFYSVIDPTVANRQAHDIGAQYQTGIYWSDLRDEAVVRAYAREEQQKHPAFLVELAPLTSFWPAEDYHQDYLDKNPMGYCHIAPAAFEEARRLTKQD